MGNGGCARVIGLALGSLVGVRKSSCLTNVNRCCSVDRKQGWLP